MNQTVIACEHERVDHDSGSLALVHFLERLRDNERVEPEGILVNAAVFERQRGRFAIRDHDDLAHVLLLARSEEHTSELQSRLHLVCRLLLEKKKKKKHDTVTNYELSNRT